MFAEAPARFRGRWAVERVGVEVEVDVLKRSFTAVSKALSDLKENILKAMLIRCFS